MIEQWIPIIGLEDKYHVSNTGRVKRLARVTINRGRPFRLKDKILTPVSDYSGYHRVSVNRTATSVHRLVAKHFIPNPENKPEVNHIDLDKSNNCVANLEWVTPKENVAHKMASYASKNGGRHWKSKLSSNDVEFIRGTFKVTHTAKQLAEKFKMDLSTIYGILRNDDWKHTNDEGKVFRRSKRLV